MDMEALKLNPIKANQTEVHLEGGTVVLFSYKTPVAAQLSTGGFIRTEKYYSRTTSKHINQWLDGVQAETVPQVTLDHLK